MNIYGTCRREFLEESLSRLGLQKLSIDEVQKLQWTQLEDEIEKWIKAINVALRILFPSERRLCDRNVPLKLGESSRKLKKQKQAFEKLVKKVEVPFANGRKWLCHWRRSITV
ncbi:exocyst complex component EXO70B1-like [Forsythia ovata]|uniref:Exocyst complex component EXO70B1-like n=1 Tax=Forsythia ovata TaxID=205694 RepID=A0ABD1VM17_9LAMI